MRIDTEIALYKLTREKLLQNYPDLANDQETLLDILEGETNLDEAIVQLLRSAEEDSQFSDALKRMEDDYNDRRVKLSERSKAKRSLAAKIMHDVGQKNIRHAYAVISLREAGEQKLVIDRENLLPDYLKTEIIPEQIIPASSRTVPDEELIRRALSDNAIVPGAKLVDAPLVISVRKK